MLNLPIGSCVGELFTKDVITKKERTKIKSFTTDREKMEHIIDQIITPSLDNKHIIKFKGLVETMENSDDSLLNDMAKKLSM